MDEKWTCRKCGAPLENKKVIFEYLGNSISHELPSCPVCGSSLIPEELVHGKMNEVETMLEDK